MHVIKKTLKIIGVHKNLTKPHKKTLNYMYYFILNVFLSTGDFFVVVVVDVSFCCFYWSLLLKAQIKQKVFGIFLGFFFRYPGCSYPVVLADFEPFALFICATDGKQAVC